MDTNSLTPVPACRSGSDHVGLFNSHDSDKDTNSSPPVPAWSGGDHVVLFNSHDSNKDTIPLTPVSAWSGGNHVVLFNSHDSDKDTNSSPPVPCPFGGAVESGCHTVLHTNSTRQILLHSGTCTFFLPTTSVLYLDKSSAQLSNFHIKNLQERNWESRRRSVLLISEVSLLKLRLTLVFLRFKGPLHDIFYLWFFHQTTTPRPLIHGLKPRICEENLRRNRRFGAQRCHWHRCACHIGVNDTAVLCATESDFRIKKSVPDHSRKIRQTWLHSGVKYTAVHITAVLLCPCSWLHSGVIDIAVICTAVLWWYAQRCHFLSKILANPKLYTKRL
jgi:hypothetical protein